VSFVGGVDVGSTATKLVLMDGDRVVAGKAAPAGVNYRQTASRLLADALEEARREPGEIEYMVATGYGRRMVDFADEVVSEITANAAGARWLTRGRAAAVRTVVDVGGQDSKAISLDEAGSVVNFAMNDRCAAGTGRFLEMMGRVLEVEIERFGELALQATEPVRISSLCAVFAESEVISILSQGGRIPDIIAALHESIAKRVGAMVKRIGVEEAVLFDGGPARNGGLAGALERELGVELIVPPEPQLSTAIGAAAIADKLRRERGRGQGGRGRDSRKGEPGDHRIY